MSAWSALSIVVVVGAMTYGMRAIAIVVCLGTIGASRSDVKKGLWPATVPRAPRSPARSDAPIATLFLNELHRTVL